VPRSSHNDGHGPEELAAEGGRMQKAGWEKQEGTNLTSNVPKHCTYLCAATDQQVLCEEARNRMLRKCKTSFGSVNNSLSLSHPATMDHDKSSILTSHVILQGEASCLCPSKNARPPFPYVNAKGYLGYSVLKPSPPIRIIITPSHHHPVNP
jgi:hypothetical protein